MQNVSDTCWNVALVSGLRRKHTLVIGTNRSKMLDYIATRFDVPNSPHCTVHSNITQYVTERCVNSLTKGELLDYIADKNYDAIVFYSTSANIDSVKACLDSPSKIRWVSY